MKVCLKVSTHFFLVLGLLLFSLRPSVTGRMGPEDSNASISQASAGSLHAESARKDSIHYRTSFSTCEKKSLHRPMIPACSVLDVFCGIPSSPRVFSMVVSKAVPSGSSPVLRI